MKYLRKLDKKLANISAPKVGWWAKITTEVM